MPIEFEQANERTNSFGTDRSAVRILAMLEAKNISGPAGNLFRFVQGSREFKQGPAFHISLAMFRRKGGAGPSADFIAAAEECGIPIHFIRERFLFDPAVILELRDLVRRLKPDLIETHAVKSHLVMRGSGLWKQYPWMAFHHGYTNIRVRSHYYNQLDRWSLRAAQQVVTVCGPFRDHLIHRGVPANRIVVLHNSVVPMNRDFQAPVSKKIELGIPPDALVVLSVGRLSKEKGHCDLILAMKHLERLRPGLPWQLIILGDGPQRKKIFRTAKKMGLSNRVHLLGHCSCVSDYYKMADVVAISSLSEGSPNVLLEAMAAGVPVVATAVGGIREIVTAGETGLLVPPRDRRAMARAIERLLVSDTESKAIAERARELVNCSYSPAVRTRSLRELYLRTCRPPLA